jgi:hypothetical protein
MSAMGTRRTSRRKKNEDDAPEVEATVAEDAKDVEAAAKAEAEEPAPEPQPEPPPPPPAPEPPPPPPPAPKKTGNPTGRYLVMLDGKVVGDPHPTKMHAIRAGAPLNGKGHVTVEPELG